MHVLCLQNIEGKTSAQIINKLNKEKDFLKQPLEKVEEKKKLLVRGEKKLVQRRFTRQLLKLGKGWPFITVWIEEGSVISGSTIIKQCDLYISYPAKAINNVKKLLGFILKAGAFVLVESDVYERVKQIEGCFDPRKLPSYKNKDIKAGLLSHLPWQVYVINSAWEKFLGNPLDRTSLRQLRVKIRRLRSMFSFFRPAVEREEFFYWKSFFKDEGDELSELRELDVILLSLSRLEEVNKKKKNYEGLLKKEFESRRDRAIEKIREKELKDITLKLAEFILYLQGRVVLQSYSALSLKKFFRMRLNEWSSNLMGLTERYQDFSNMLEAHKIRIKVKRFRYVVLSLPEINSGTVNMLRKLKRLQDVLGFMHDDYVNSKLVQEIDIGTSDTLAYEIALFVGWESAKVEASIEQVESLWEDFCDELKAWKK